jgi:hypothetical protein
MSWLSRAGAVTTALAVAAVLGPLGSAPPVRASPSTASAPPAAWFDRSVGGVTDAVLTALAAGQLDQLVARRARAVRDHDLGAFLADVDPSKTATARATYTALGVVPFRRYALRVVSVSSSDHLRAGVVDGVVDGEVRLRYRLPGDTTDVVRTVTVGLRRDGARWRVERWTPDRPDLWDLGPVAVSRRGAAIVLGSARRYDQTVLEGLADLTEAALRGVDELWPYRWAQRATVILPPDTRAMIALLDAGADVSGLAGVTTVERAGGGVAVRVTVNPRYYPTLGPVARQIVLRHELTHVAQFGLNRSGVPQWLVEGLAEHFGYTGSGVPRSFVAADLLDEVRSGNTPGTLPDDDAFAFAASRAARGLAYRSGWTACEYIADTFGEAQLMRFYRAVATGSGSSARRVRQASREILSVTTGQLTSGWQSWLRDLA